MVKTQIQNSSRVLETKPQSFKDFFLRNSYKVLIASLVINLVFFLPPPVQAIGVLLLFPLVCVGMFVMIYENCGPGAALLALRKFVNGTFWRMMGLQVLLALVSFILFFFLDSPALWLLIHFLKWNVMVDQQTLNNIYTFLMHFFTIFSMNLLLPLSFIGFSLQYFSLKEINDAAHLKERILLVGVKNGRA